MSRPTAVVLGVRAELGLGAALCRRFAAAGHHLLVAGRERLGEDGLLGIDAIAETDWQIHRRQRSAWTHEVDLRPFEEGF